MALFGPPLTTENDEMFAEINRLSEEVERQRISLGRIDSLTDVMGHGLKPTVFSLGNNSFETLPHETASMIDLATTQSIDTATYTTVIFTTLRNSTYIGYEHGFEVESSLGRIHIEGRPGLSVYHISGFINFVANSSGGREIRWASESGGAITIATQRALVGQGTVVPFSFYRRATEDDNFFFLLAWQNSGAGLDLSDRQLAVTRVR